MSEGGPEPRIPYAPKPTPVSVSNVGEEFSSPSRRAQLTMIDGT